MKKVWICLIVIVLGFGFLSQCKKSEATKPQFTLTVVLTEGVEGTPGNGVQSHQDGQTINYNYNLKSGYINLVVTIDGQVSGSSGTLTMNANHTIEVTAEFVNFVLKDIVGKWSGSAGSFNLDLTVASDGKVTGSGVSSKWSVGNTGKVSGGGSFSVISGGWLIVASCGWNLQLNGDRNELTGKMTVAHSSIGTKTVKLNKK